jgi:hypothetical protein
MAVTFVAFKYGANNEATIASFGFADCDESVRETTVQLIIKTSESAENTFSSFLGSAAANTLFRRTIVPLMATSHHSAAASTSTELLLSETAHRSSDSLPSDAMCDAEICCSCTITEAHVWITWQ